MRLKVAVRVRPDFSSSEFAGEPRASVGRAGAAVSSSHATTKDDDMNALLGSGTTASCFDAVFGPDSTQHSVFATCAAPLLDAMLHEGLNGCLFAFGQSGSGKTFSMLGGSGGGKKRQLDGVIPRIADELFLRISRAQADSGGSVQFQVRGTYLEVYDDNVFDLLSQPSRDEKRRTLEIRDASVPAAQVETVTSTGVLMDLIARGSSQRATQATGIHDNSSRSHAIVTLTLERRWTKGKGEVRSSSCSLQLVDLAGSESTDRAHNGTADRAGCSINMGLLVLRRTIQALAAGAHVPYRSASLTKLLYPSLSGGSVTWMLATVSPEPIDAYESQQTMQWAQEARRLMMRPVAAPQVIEDASLKDPLYGDMEDSDEEMQRRCEWIQTATYGDVWARVAGDKSHSLLLMIHGSGPRNSSLQWNWLVEQVMSSDNSLKFFCVAVDCPGYGRTRGDRQIIRSYPGKFIAQVLTALGRSTAYAIIGSSQGACAVLNAALELPDIAHFVAVCHPVGHAPERYTAIQQPVLLAFDTEDAGHPVSVGRIMQRRLPRAHYFEFTTSKDGNWLEKEFGRELLNMFQAYPAPRAKPGALTTRLPYLTRLSGGVMGWSKAEANECRQYEVPLTNSKGAGEGARSGGSNASLVCESEDELEDELEAASASVGAGDGAGVWVGVVHGVTGSISYRNTITHEECTTLPVGARMQPPPASAANAGALFEGVCQDDGDEPETEHAIRHKQLQEEEREKAQTAALLSQTKCSRCTLVLVSPVVIRPCSHVQCAACAARFAKCFRRCSKCGVEATSFAKAPEAMLRNLAHTVANTEGMAEEEEQQQKLLESIEKQGKALVFEYGNEASPCGAEDARVRRKQTTFLRPLSKAATDALKQVSFNINPGYDGVRMELTSNPSGKARYELGRAMTRSFPCFITLVFSDKMSLKIRSLKIEYWTQHEQARSTRFVAIASGQGQGKGVNPEKGLVMDGKSNALLLVGPKGEVWIEPNSCAQRSSVDCAESSSMN